MPEPGPATSATKLHFAHLNVRPLMQNFDVGAAFISAGDGLTLLELLHKGAVTVSFPDEIAVRH